MTLGAKPFSKAPHSGFLAVILAIFVAGVFCSSAAAGGEPVTVTKYTDPSQVIKENAKSNWKQPWRSYMDTVPATTLLKAVGINFNVYPQYAEQTSTLLEHSGFTRARVEFGWNSLSYDNPSQLTVSAKTALVTDLTAMKEHGIRPLILLNANSGEPCPVKKATISLLAPVEEGATELHISPSDVDEIVPGKTGIRSGGTSANYLFSSVSPQGTVKLSAPLGSLWQNTARGVVKSLPAGPLEIETLRYEPFHPEKLANGSPNPAFEPTMQGWLNYVGVITREAKAVLGSEAFDVEVWNELSFGSRFLEVRAYYSPPVEENRYWNEDAILARTINYLRDPAHGVANVGIGNGFANQSPGWGPEDSPAGLTAQDKHPYAGWRHFPAAEKTDGLRPLDGQGAESGTQANNYTAGFTPTYDSFFPEYFLSGILNQTLIRDLSPTRNWYAGSWHGRDVPTPGGGALQHWTTEVNLDPKAGPATGMSAADSRHVESKEILRYLVSFVNKGMTAIDFYAATGGGLALVDNGFFEALKKHPSAYPGDDVGGETMTAVGRLADAFSGATAGVDRSLSLDALTDFKGNVQFEGNGTAKYPPLYNRDVFAFLPFQVTDSRFVIPVYVMTRNVVKEYKSGSDPSRFDLPPEPYEMTIGGINGEGAHVEASDPLTGASVPVEVVSGSASQIVLKMPVTDSPRTLTIQEAAGAEPPEEPEVPEEPEEPEPEEPEEENPLEEEAEESELPPPGGGRPTAPAPTVPVEVKASADENGPGVRLILRGGSGLLEKHRLTAIASCDESCFVHFSGYLQIGGHTYRMRAPKRGPQASSTGAAATIQLRINSGAVKAARAALKQDDEIEAIVSAAARGSTGKLAVAKRALAITR